MTSMQEHAVVPRDVSIRTVAIVTGIAILVMAVVAAYAAGYVPGSLNASGDAETTARNIGGSETLFRSGILGLLIILVCDVVVAWGLYVFLKPVNQSISLLTTSPERGRVDVPRLLWLLWKGGTAAR